MQGRLKQISSGIRPKIIVWCLNGAKQHKNTMCKEAAEELADYLIEASDIPGEELESPSQSQRHVILGRTSCSLASKTTSDYITTEDGHHLPVDQIAHCMALSRTSNPSRDESKDRILSQVAKRDADVISTLDIASFPLRWSVRQHRRPSWRCI